jgi:hypothetical protein
MPEPFDDASEFEGGGEEQYRSVGCPEHGRSAVRPLCGSWECDGDAILHHGHAVYRCARCDRSFEHDISGPDVQWIIHHGR